MRWSGSSPAADRRATCSTPTDVLLVWDDNAWQDYLWWQQQDRKILKRINLLLQNITRNGNEGIDKPEPSPRRPGGARIAAASHRPNY